MPGINTPSLRWDYWFWAALAAAVPFWLVLWAVAPSTYDLSLQLLRPLHEPMQFLLLALVQPVLEEIAFRGGLQPVLAHRLTQRWGVITIANLLTSLVFSGMHFIFHTPLWAAAVFLPSLVFGYFYERHNSLFPPIALHVFYNAGYFWLFGF